VKRIVDPQDRRARYARITKKGEALLDEFMPVHYRNLKSMLQDLSSEEKDTLVSLLKRVRSSISAHGDPELG
jgi:DNA-binding MarR family transcriptional regulator